VRALRLVAVGAIVAGIALPLARRRLRLPPPVTAAVAAAAPFGLAVAVPRSRARDAAVYGLQMWAYIVVHELPYDDPRRLERRVRVDYPIRLDQAVFGASPNVALQRLLARTGRTTALDHALVWIHWAWFLQPHAAAAWILWRHPNRFPRAAVMMCAVFDLGLVGYFAVPTAPPWWAAEQGRIPGLRRIMAEVGERVWGRLWSPLYGFLGGNPLAAMPSLHFATSLMAARMLAETGRVAGAAGWAYASVLGFALVYLGEHYVVDLIAGAVLAEGIRRLGPQAAPLVQRVAATVRRLEERAT
jgi:membrane-associated phospholipid phosphatase